MNNSTESSQPAMTIWTPRVRDHRSALPEDFVPQPYSVHIGRGKICAEATGNRRLRVIASSFLEEYKAASTKIEKSVIVSKIVDVIQDACPVGAFVKYQDGRWWEVGDFTAREKVGSMLRDYLSDKYRSSSKAKLARRKKARQDSKTKKSVVVTILEIKSKDALDQQQLQQEETKKVVKKALPTLNQVAPRLEGSMSLSLASQLSNERNSRGILSAKTDALQLQQLSSSLRMNHPLVRMRNPSAAPLLGGFHDIDNGSNICDFPW
jgi:hypothetical protein